MTPAAASASTPHRASPAATSRIWPGSGSARWDGAAVSGVAVGSGAAVAAGVSGVAVPAGAAGVGCGPSRRRGRRRRQGRRTGGRRGTCGRRGRRGGRQGRRPLGTDRRDAAAPVAARILLPVRRQRDGLRLPEPIRPKLSGRDPEEPRGVVGQHKDTDIPIGFLLHKEEGRFVLPAGPGLPVVGGHLAPDLRLLGQPRHRQLGGGRRLPFPDPVGHHQRLRRVPVYRQFQRPQAGQNRPRLIQKLSGYRAFPFLLVGTAGQVPFQPQVGLLRLALIFQFHRPEDGELRRRERGARRQPEILRLPRKVLHHRSRPGYPAFFHRGGLQKHRAAIPLLDHRGVLHPRQGDPRELQLPTGLHADRRAGVPHKLRAGFLPADGEGADAQAAPRFHHHRAGNADRQRPGVEPLGGGKPRKRRRDGGVTHRLPGTDPPVRQLLVIDRHLLDRRLGRLPLGRCLCRYTGRGRCVGGCGKPAQHPQSHQRYAYHPCDPPHLRLLSVRGIP